MLSHAQGYEKFGFNVASNGDITYREWAPNATTAHLIGDFSMLTANLFFLDAMFYTIKLKCLKINGIQLLHH